MSTRPPLRRRRSYAIGNIRVVEHPEEGVRSHFLALKVRHRLGFLTRDVQLVMKKSKFDPTRHVGLFATEVDEKGTRMHMLVHALHERLHKNARMRIRKGSVFFKLSHEFFGIFEDRGHYYGMRSIRKENPFNRLRAELRKPLTRKSFDSVAAFFMMACTTKYPSRIELARTVEKLFTEREYRALLRRLNNQPLLELVNPEDATRVRADLLTLADFFEREAGQSHPRHPTLEHK